MEKQNGTCVHLPRTEPTGSPAAPRCNRLATTARKEALVFAYPVWSTGKSGGEKIAPPRRFFLRESDRLGSSVAQLIPIRSDSGVFGRRIEAMSLPQSTRELVAIGPVVFIPGFDKAGDELLRGFFGDHQAGMHQIAPGMHTGPSGDVLFKVHPLGHGCSHGMVNPANPVAGSATGYHMLDDASKWMQKFNFHGCRLARDVLRASEFPRKCWRRNSSSGDPRRLPRPVCARPWSQSYIESETLPCS